MTNHKATTAIAIIVLALVIMATSIGRAEAHVVTPQTCTAVASIYPADQRRAVRARCVRLAAKHKRAHTCQRADLTPFQAIDCIWPAWGRSDAKHVAQCESTANVSNEYARANGKGRWARNGQYWGVMQEGDDERARYGPYQIGSDARIQIRTSLAHFRATGWGAWDSRCRP